MVGLWMSGLGVGLQDGEFQIVLVPGLLLFELSGAGTDFL